MRDLEKDITVALKLLDGGETANNLGNYNLMYGMTNENIDSYFKYFPIKDSNVLTVLGSGDFVLQSALFNPKKIYAFDYNPLSLYMGKLKITSLSNLEYHEFINYFYNANKEGYFSIKYYKKVRDYLDSNVKIFWDTIYSNKEYDITSNLIMIDGLNKNRSNDSFLSNNNYYLTKNNLKNIDVKYYCSDVFDILSKISNDKKFDSVFLSNIFDWMNLKDKAKYPLFIKRDLSKYLTDNGMVCVRSSVNGYKDTPLDIIFKDYIDIKNKDKVLVYKNKKENKI